MHAGGAKDAVQRWGGRVPIMLGATGHRNIEPQDAKLIAALSKQCRELRNKYPDSPFVILSALAEGADRMIAEVAMKELSADLIAVLPVPEEEYERDFGTEASKTEFRTLLDRALFVKTAQVPGDASWKTVGEPRNEQYARAGAIIADHSHILFAIWDGKPSRGTGGTGEQVKWFERGRSPREFSPYKNALSPLAPSEPGLSIRIDPASAAVSIEPPGKKSFIRSILKRTNKYNCDANRDRGAIEKSASLAIEAMGKVKNLAVTDVTYRAANQLSINFATKVRRSDSIVYILALVAIVAFNLISAYALASWMYLGVTLVMAALASHIWFFTIDNRFLEYRSLAEAMRTLFFWRNAGVASPVWLAYLTRQTGVVQWLRQAVRTMEFCQDCQLPVQQEEAPDRSDGVRLAKVYWVDGQKIWFRGKEVEHARRFRFWRGIFYAAIGGSFITAIILAALTVMPNETGGKLWYDVVKPDVYGNLWEAALGLFAAGGLAARGFLTRRAHLELMKQYASQRLIFETASGILETIESERKPEWTAGEVLEKLGEEALQEQAEWVWLRHTRPFEVPTP
ncbi:MAG: hypothetical protein ACLPPF_23440 [Rhodomicrobium sp.]